AAGYLTISQEIVFLRNNNALRGSQDLPRRSEGTAAKRKTPEGADKRMEEILQVGVISSTHGIRGEVKVFPTTDDPTRFEDLKEVILDTGREHRILAIQGVKYFKQFVILKF